MAEPAHGNLDDRKSVQGPNAGAQPQLSASVVGAYKFGRAASRRICLPKACSPNSRLSLAFSFCISCSCLACKGSSEPYFFRQRQFIYWGLPRFRQTPGANSPLSSSASPPAAAEQSVFHFGVSSSENPFHPLLGPKDHLIFNGSVFREGTRSVRPLF